jgi:sugar phosphate isomerase/epimerase
MYAALNVTDDSTHCGHIGHVVKDFATSCRLARRHGFRGVNVDLRPGSRLEAAEYRRILAKEELLPVSFGFPADLFGTPAEFDLSLGEFETQCRLASAIGCGLTLCYLPPFSDELSFCDRFVQTVERLRRLSPVLRQNNLRVGFEFIGPTETRRDSKYDFIHTMDGTRALIAAAGLHGLAGFKLDVHHWKHSGAGLLDLHHCEAEYLLYVELNDGAAGHDRFTMPEFARELPLATGVNDVAGFLKALHHKRYRGPVVVEPWNQRIRDLPLEDAIGAVKCALDRCLNIADSRPQGRRITVANGAMEVTPRVL